MSDFPRSLIEFQQRFSDEEACAKYLFASRWPQGFVCPGCGTSKAWELQTKSWTWECVGCGRQTSVTAGTIMHHSKLPLTTWFWAAYLMATHSNGISALQLQRQLGLGSYRSAWLLCGKLRHSMVAPGRTALAGLCRSKADYQQRCEAVVTEATILKIFMVRSPEEDHIPHRLCTHSVCSSPQREKQE